MAPHGVAAADRTARLRSLPVRRPIATSMLFLGLVLIGAIAWRQLPVELFPPLTGTELFINFARPGSEPEAVEREILIPLESRLGEVEGIQETRGYVTGSSGNLRVTFKTGVDVKTRELDLRRIASDLSRQQPRGGFVEVSSQNLDEFGRFAMVLNVGGGDDVDALADFVDERIEPRLAGVPGVARAFVMGGSPREAKVTLDPDRMAALGVTPGEVAASLARSVTRLRFVGNAHDDRGQTAVIVDGRPHGLVSLGELRVSARSAVKLSHVASIDFGAARRDSAYRVNGKPALAVLIFQEQGENLVRLGRDLRARIAALNDEFKPLGIELTVATDFAQLIEDQLERLKSLAGSGFLISLVVLFLFLRQVRAVLVVAIAVPVSLLIALGALLLVGQTLNLITLFGLAVAVGMLVDNSIVVYEAVQRRLERGASVDHAIEEGLRRTVRAILASTVTNAIVFLPLMFVDLGNATLQSLVKILALAVVLPQLASLLVAVGLVPLLTRWLAAPAATRAVRESLLRRARLAGMRPPDRARELFTGLITVALRRPAGWLTSVTIACVFATLFVAPMLLGGAAGEPPEATEIRLNVTLPSGNSLQSATDSFSRLEYAAQQVKGVTQVEAMVQETGGTVTVRLADKDKRPPEVDAETVRSRLRQAAENARRGIRLDTLAADGGQGGGDGGGGGAAARLGGGAAEVKLSGPDAARLRLLAEDIRSRLASISEIASATIAGREGLDELVVTPRAQTMHGYGLTADEVLPELSSVRREGVELRVGFTQPDGREIPLVLRRREEKKETPAMRTLAQLQLATRAGVLPLDAVADVRRMPPPAVIEHHDGRREVRVSYRFSGSAPSTGPARVALEERIKQELRAVERPAGYAVEPPSNDTSTSLIKKLLVPIVLLLFAVLAITFESLVMPVVVLLALPLTIIGATTGLLLNGLPLDPMGTVGVVALLGLTVNPAILLVDRMQDRMRGGHFTAGAAALAAVRERTRPVLMTTATTLAGLWPLALVTGQENEIWPPFATVVIGGLMASTILTLLVIPIGYTLAAKLDRLFGRLGPWVVLVWGSATTLCVTPLFVSGLIDSMTWRVLTTLFTGGVLLGVAALWFLPAPPEPVQAGNSAPQLTVRFLHKVYGQPGPIGYAWRVTDLFARRVLARGGTPFDRRDARAVLPVYALVALASGYLAWNVRSGFWGVCWLSLAVGLLALMLKALRRARGHADALGKTTPGGWENRASLALWWLAWPVPWWLTLDRDWRDHFWLVLSGLMIFVVQWGRRTVLRAEAGRLSQVSGVGTVARLRTLWRRRCQKWLAFDMPLRTVHALAGAEFEAQRGMIGILGPNGAGKTTLLRILAGILEPTRGVVELGGVRLFKIQKVLARWVGYLPQDFGLPNELTARQYLEYWGLLYEVGDARVRHERVEQLLVDVGLGARADEKIGSFSGGMRQRVAVARTLLRLPSVIIVDEPTVGLDPRERIRFRNLLSRLAVGRIVLFSTHVVEDVAVACERVIVFARGKIVFDGAPADLASAADGKVWEVRLGPLESEAELVPGALVSDLLPLQEGGSKLRVLCATAPHPAAVLTDASLEDGYLMLVGSTSRERATT
ncbi:MAG: efflux RND transporter permease subunit [Acidobacteriota bacterium]